MMKAVEKLKRGKFVIISVALIVWVGYLYLENLGLKSQIVYEQTIPDVELINYLSVDERSIASGEVTGFVAFENEKKQPRNLRQYTRITASDDFLGGKQVFYITDIIKMDAIPPSYFEPVIAIANDTSGSTITLVDEANNMWLVNKYTGEVSTLDNTGDATKLITNQSDFREFMTNFLKS